MSENQADNKVFTLSVANVRGQKTNTNYPNVKEIYDEAELKEALKFDHVAGELQNGVRGDKNFIRCNALIMDCDNDEFEKERIKKGEALRENPDEWLTPDDLSKRLDGVKFYICYSKSHNKMKDDFSPRARFHVYFLLRNEITEASEIRPLKDKILKLVPEFDGAAKDATRFIFGIENPEITYFDGGKCIDEVLPTEEQIEITEEPIKPVKSDVIVEGSRNDTLYHDGVGIYLHNLLEKADKLFLKKCGQCIPPLPHSEEEQIRRNCLNADIVKLRYMASKILLNATSLEEGYKKFCDKCKFGTEEQKNEAWEVAIKLHEKNEKQQQREKIENAEADFLEGKKYFTMGTPKHEEIYEYNSKLGLWENKNMGDLWHDIRAHFNKKIDDKTKNTIANHIYSDFKISDDTVLEWNMAEKWNFPNGTLNLATGKLEAHDEKNGFNYVMDYDYDASADCPKFKKFIKDFVNDEQTRLTTCEDMLGYILAPNTNEQKLFFIYGTGGNGKTTLSNILKRVLGGRNKKNVTSIPIEDIDKPTERIYIEKSLLNIAPDCDYFVTKEQCDTLKRITGSDSVRGNRKFKDTKEFRTRTKFIFGFNDTPTISDLQQGMRDRLIFMKLERNFRQEKTLNKNLEAELIEEKAGIFNYIFECYKRLKANGGIRPCCDQNELMQKTQIASNLVAMWYDDNKEELYGNSFTRERVHEKYVEWSKNLNLKKIWGKKTFYQKLRDFLPSSLMEERRTGNNYTFTFTAPIEPKTDEPKEVPQNDAQQEIHFETDEPSLADKINVFIKEAELTHLPTNELDKALRANDVDEAKKILMSYIKDAEEKQFTLWIAGYKEIYKRLELFTTEITAA